MRRSFLALAALAIAVSDPRAAADCYSIVAGAKATADGSVLFGHNEDNGLDDPCGLVSVPRKEHGEGEWVAFPGGARIPQARITFAYWWLRMPGLAYSDGLLNEHGVAVASDACRSREDRAALVDGGAGGSLLRRLVAERARTAREGVELVGSLIERFGYAASGRTMIIADPGEGWLVAMVQGKHWVAARVPDDEVALIANTYTIGEVDLADPKRFLGAPDLIAYARERGWYDPADGPFRFEAAYAAREAREAPSNTRRQWSGLRRLAADSVPPPEAGRLPFSVRPKAPLTVDDLKAVLRDHYEGTPLREGATYRNRPPHRGEPRAICVPTTNASSIFVLRAGAPAERNRTWWLALWQPCSTPYLPLDPTLPDVPAAMALRDEGFSPAYRTFGDLARWVDRDYAGRIEPVRKRWRAFESRLAGRRASPEVIEEAMEEARRLMGAGGGAGDDGGIIIEKPQRTLEAIDRIYGDMKPVRYTPPSDRWVLLPRTRKRLAEGGTLRIVMLGDSIINDTSRSSWTLLLDRAYPSCRVEAVTSVRGSTGCWWYKETGRVEKYVLDHEPDLVLIGGISQRDDVDSIREVIRQIRAASPAEFLLMTGPFGRVDPRDDAQWSYDIDPGAGDYRARLLRLAGDEKCAFLDMFALWGLYVRESGQDLETFKRDVVHADERGEQILGRILEHHFSPVASTRSDTSARE
ncbi:MAG: C69 family dipeptidase [Planctomycetes bacterium]|nr:C69 family dipeptidase [Planctomycetota bacterium]